MSRYVSSSVRCDVSRLLQYLRLSSLRRMAPFIPYSKKLSMPAPTPLKPGASHCPCVAPMVLPSRLCVDRRFQRARYARWAKVLTHVKSSNPIENGRATTHLESIISRQSREYRELQDQTPSSCSAFLRISSFPSPGQTTHTFPCSPPSPLHVAD